MKIVGARRTNIRMVGQFKVAGRRNAPTDKIEHATMQFAKRKRSEPDHGRVQRGYSAFDDETKHSKFESVTLAARTTL